MEAYYLRLNQTIGVAAAFLITYMYTWTLSLPGSRTWMYET